jgi:hypothetical protein
MPSKAGSGGPSPVPLYPVKYDVSFGFNDVFAGPTSDRKSFQEGPVRRSAGPPALVYCPPRLAAHSYPAMPAALQQENAGLVDHFFLSAIITPGEGYRLLKTYGRALDVVCSPV